jgi:GMP synthase PP-ATPase subunit
VEWRDAKTAEGGVILPCDLLEKVARRIINEVKGIDRCVLDICRKLPGTSESE